MSDPGNQEQDAVPPGLEPESEPVLVSTPVPESGAAVESGVEPEPEPALRSGPVPDSEPVPDGEPTRLRMRRAPRYLPFGVTGTALGVAVGLILALSISATPGPALDDGYSTQTILGYFAAIFGLFGAVGGLGLAVLLERRRS